MPTTLIEDKNIPTGEDKLIPSDLPLFNPNTLLPGKNDIRQRSIACCYLDAALQSMVSCDPDLIRQLFVDETPTTVMVRLFDDEKNACYYSIDKSILCDSGGKPLQAHAYLWPHLLEKALTLHFRQDPIDTLQKRMTSGSVNKVFHATLCNSGANRIDVIIYFVKVMLLSKKIREEEQGWFNDYTMEFDWGKYSNDLQQLVSKLTLVEKNTLDNFLLQSDLGLPADLLNVYQENFNQLSHQCEELISYYQTVFYTFIVTYLQRMCDDSDLMLTIDIYKVRKHGFTICGIGDELNNNCSLILRDPWGNGVDERTGDLGLSFLNIDDMLKSSLVLTICDKSKSRYCAQLLNPKLSLFHNHALATLYVSNIIQSMGIKNLSRAEQTRAAKVIGVVLSQSEELASIEQNQSKDLQGVLADLIDQNIVQCTGVLSYLSLGFFNNDYCTIDTSDEGLTPQDINHCLDSLFSEESKMWAYV